MTGNQYVIDSRTDPYSGDTVRLVDRRPLGGAFLIRLASEMCHAFASEAEARSSQYWPSSSSVIDR